MTSFDREDLVLAARKIARAHGPGIALTGAGISVESGIPDFRSAGGIWERYDPAEYATIEAFLADPVKVWGFLVELEALVRGSRPNAAHEALVHLERAGRLSAVVTQNVDGLHQAAGSREVVEFHGSGRRLACLGCRTTIPVERADPDRHPPTCAACGQILKPDVVLFGEAIPYGALRRSRELVEQASFVLVVGTSATVHPASQLPSLARQSGASIIEVNLEPTPLSGRIADVSIHGPAGEVLPALVELVQGA